jgi:hypothetical protein
MNRIGEPGEPGPVVRPYTMTGGRVHARHGKPGDVDLELEALVSTSSLGQVASDLNFERRSIVQLCSDVQSIAEISARLDLPLGVARVLVGDMAGEGLVDVHRPSRDGERPGIDVLERVLEGLQRID